MSWRVKLKKAGTSKGGQVLHNQKHGDKAVPGLVNLTFKTSLRTQTHLISLLYQSEHVGFWPHTSDWVDAGWLPQPRAFPWPRKGMFFLAPTEPPVDFLGLLSWVSSTDPFPSQPLFLRNLCWFGKIMIHSVESFQEPVVAWCLPANE